MDKPELQQITAFLNDVQEGLCGGDEDTALRLNPAADGPDRRDAGPRLEGSTGNPVRI
jgi:hypothetical protein